MSGLIAYAGTMLRLQFRSRLAVFYSFLFPLIFLIAFRILYRFDVLDPRAAVKVWTADHLGELLVVAILGGTCFGLPVTMVAERERGVWRRYRLLPTPIWTLVGGTMGVRFVLLLGAGLLQLLAALGLSMNLPSHPAELLLGFTIVSFTFCSFGLIVAMLTNSVQAAQALGQCIFLPMLALGGVAVRLTNLPHWTQTLAAFTPGRYAVELLHACSGGLGLGLASVRYQAVALVVMGVAAAVSAAKMFRWDVRGGHERGSRLGWLTVTLAACLAVGFTTLRREAPGPELHADNPVAEAPVVPAPALADSPASAPASPPAPRPEEKIYGAEKAETWQQITVADLKELPRSGLPPDRGIYTPIAAPEDEIDDDTRAEVMAIYGRMPKWEPGNVSDPVARVRNIINVAAMVDVLQIAPLEQFMPIAVEWFLYEAVPPADLARQLAWIACHPIDGPLLTFEDLQKLDIPARPGAENDVRARLQIYAAKFLFRLIDDPDSGALPKDPAAK
jgi:hypothetical protein